MQQHMNQTNMTVIILTFWCFILWFKVIPGNKNSNSFDLHNMLRQKQSFSLTKPVFAIETI